MLLSWSGCPLGLAYMLHQRCALMFNRPLMLRNVPIHLQAPIPIDLIFVQSILETACSHPRFDASNSHLHPKFLSNLQKKTPVYHPALPVFAPHALSSSGYVQVEQDGKVYALHRVAALYGLFLKLDCLSQLPEDVYDRAFVDHATGQQPQASHLMEGISRAGSYIATRTCLTWSWVSSPMTPGCPACTDC